MKNEIRLFLNDKELEFSQDPKILLNYKETELHNPTIVRNAFTKKITVEGTNRNNDIFGHIWNLDRIQEGMQFNPIFKTDFQLFVNDELYQKGYAKLEKVTRTNNTTQYEITLYGSLGTFFYNLSYSEGTNLKKTLADLFYCEEGLDEPDMDFNITKDNVYEAWGQLAGFGSTINGRWDIINFIPCYNGYPGDFDAAKVLINNYHLNQTGYYETGFRNGVTSEGVTYRPVLNGALNQYGYTLGEMPHDMTEWETRDLRCWMQRPCISMYKIIEACGNPQNNGGFQLKLDSHFFHAFNPYYRDAWVTMPLLKDLEGVEGGESFVVSSATLSTSATTINGAKYYNVEFGGQSLASINNINLNINLEFVPESATSATNIYVHRTFESKASSPFNGNTYVKTFESNCGVVLQMFAYGVAGEVVGQSKAYYFGGSSTFPHSKEKMWNKFFMNGDTGTEPEYVYLGGYFKKVNGHYVFVDNNGNPTNVNFTFSAPSNFATVQIKMRTPRGEWTKYLWSGSDGFKANTSDIITAYSSPSAKDSSSHKYTQGAARNLDRVAGSWKINVVSLEAEATDYEGLFSGTKITKQRLLTTEATPADYLLSYCKLFGLYFYYDSTEEADDPVTYPSGVVHIMDRDTFYTEEVVDLSKMIDWDKKIEITPALAAAKWYTFDVEHNESEVESGYKEQFGKSYGSQTVNTSYNFDDNSVNLYDGNVFKSGVMALEKDKYFKQTNQKLPVYQYNGLKYNLFYRTASDEEFQTYEMNFPYTTSNYMSAINPDYEYFDALPKIQMHTDDNSPSDGDNELVFFKVGMDTSCDYWLTDDVTDMAILNDGTPCWLLTRDEYDGAGTQIARKLTMLPYFTRDLTLAGTTGNIVHSWNFGHPQLTYIPDTFTTDGDSIYDVSWKNYIRDLYDVDTRKLTCYVRAELDGKPWPYWLRRFYWFENSIWRLNEIKDLNPASFDTTKMEFIKVQDINNYKLDRIEWQGNNQIVLTTDTLACTGGTVNGMIILQGAGGWLASDIISGIDTLGNHYYLDTDDVMSPRSGHGEAVTNFTVQVPANNGDAPIVWTVSFEDDADMWHRARFTQETCNTGSTLAIIPSAATANSQAWQTVYTVAYVRVSGITVSSNAAWATATYANNTLTVAYTDNLTPSSRTATITVSGEGEEGPISATATLTQKGLGGVDTDADAIVIDYNDTTSKTLEVLTENGWTSTINDN